MKNFTFERATDQSSALVLMDNAGDAKFLGGGTNLIDLMRENIEQPDTLIDISRAPLADIETLPNGGLRLGATARNSAVANNSLVRDRYPVLSQAILNGASAQLRNMATTGGNLLQRTRCYYFYDTTSRCNKREPGAGCDAIQGFNRIHAILGTSPYCIATHPSDMCVALTMLDATVNVIGKNGSRVIPFGEFHRLPGDTPHIDTNLQSGELITSVDLPDLPIAKNSMYRKVRDRASYAFALVSVAAALEISNGTITHVRIALGGVAHKPWRASAAEAYLVGKQCTEDEVRKAADLELADATPFEHNAFKIELAKRTIIGVLQELSQNGGAPQ